jgi:hypothetical protein
MDWTLIVKAILYLVCMVVVVWLVADLLTRAWFGKE